jgi:pseudouridine-5'-phosphate glycosidase
MLIADMAGIRVFATGGIGGVHRGAQETMDISADLQEFAHTKVCVISAGCKSILDIGLTLEYLETYGVPVLGYQTMDFPAFYSEKSGFGVDYEVKDADEVAKILKTKWDLGLEGGVLVGNPIPHEYSMDHKVIDGVIDKALEMAKEKNIHGKATTPFLLATIKDLTGGDSLASNLQLAYNNARVASKIAVAYAKL